MDLAPQALSDKIDSHVSPGKHRRGSPDTAGGTEEQALPLRASSFDEWWHRASALAGPLANILSSLPDPAVEALRDWARKATKPFEVPTGLEFPGVALIASAHRA